MRISDAVLDAGREAGVPVLSSSSDEEDGETDHQQDTEDGAYGDGYFLAWEKLRAGVYVSGGIRSTG